MLEHIEPLLAGVDPTSAAIGIGMSFLAGYLLRNDDEDRLQNDKPTQLSKRGSYVAWFIGVRRIAPVFCHAWSRAVFKEKAKCGKGTLLSPKSDVFYENGWHALSVGPVDALNEIIEAGKVIFQGPITPSSHPSGTVIELEGRESFQIFWGESTQPNSSAINSAIGVNSKWPGLCYILWFSKRLGAAPLWPALDYVLERRPKTGLLTQSDAWKEPTQALTGATHNVDEALANADEDVGYLQFEKNVSWDFVVGKDIELVGTGMTNGTYTILRTEVILFSDPPRPNGTQNVETVTRVHIEGGTVGVTPAGAGTAQLWDQLKNDGANIAHATAEMLFARYPLGLGFDPDHIAESWGLDSLEELGVEAENAEWISSILAQQGAKAKAILGNIMQDHGMFLPIDQGTGSLRFARIRTPVPPLDSLGSSIRANKQPEITTDHDEPVVDKLVFAFKDRSREYADMTITVDDDGRSSYVEYQKPRKVQIFTTNNYATAAALAELRAPEELSTSTAFKFDAAREARGLMPGDAITAAGFTSVLRVISVKIDDQDERVEVNVMPDAYGVPLSTFEVGNGGGFIVRQPPVEDPQFIWFEVPEQTLGGLGNIMTVLALHIRDNSQTDTSAQWISEDDSTYILMDYDSQFQTGGTLDEALSADGPSFLALGPEYTELGPDNATLTQDLSSSLTNWGLGRQLCVIRSDAGFELCYLQKATITGGSTRRLDGLLRGRLDTRKLDHPIGAQVYIFDRSAVLPMQDVILQPKVSLYLKSQPSTNAGSVNLSAVARFEEILYGKGQRPITPDFVYVREPVLCAPSFLTGNNIRLSWSASSGSIATGAGAQDPGTSLSAPVVPGIIELEFLTIADASQGTLTVDASDLSRVILNSELVTLFSSEPSSFKVRARHVANGLASEYSPSLLITRN